MKPEIDAFSWGCMFHFLGRDDLALPLLRKINRASPYGIRPIARLLISFIDGGGLERERRAEILKKIEEKVTKSLSNDASCLGMAREYDRTPPTSFLEPAPPRDSELKGYSRDPFRKFRTPEHCKQATLGAVLYVLRAYAGFFRVARPDRDFNHAKPALNDCYQAGQLIWRVYRDWELSHYSQHHGWDEIALDVVRDLRARYRTPLGLMEPHISPSFLWHTFVTVDIMRGNIYYQAGFAQNADRFYGKALRRVAKVLDLVKYRRDCRVIQRIMTSTVIRARFERSKITFDNGCFLEALVEQLECIKSIMIMKSQPVLDDNKQDFRNKMDDAIGFLKVEMEAPLWDKRIIGAMFDFGNPDYFGATTGRSGYKGKLHRAAFHEFWSRNEVIKARDMLKSCSVGADPETGTRDDRTEMLVADIFARIAFTLLILLVVKDRKFFETGYVFRWLKDYLRPPRIDHRNFSAMAQYCETMVNPRLRAMPLRPFRDNLERQFALRLREFLARSKKDTDTGNYRKYLILLDAMTHNIGNLVTIPRRNQKLLMRHGYISRRETDVRDRKGPENKFVVLRRWQSFNPRLPRPDSHKLRGGGYLLVWQRKGIVIDPGYDFIQNLYEEGFSLEDIHAIIVSHSHPDHDDDLSTLLTMFYEWREYRSKIGISGEKDRKIDLFLNESCFRKFSAWVHSEKMVIGRVVPLPQLVWHKDSTKHVVERGRSKRVGPRRGRNVVIDLTGEEGYSMKLEVVPALHDDVLGKTSAAGFIFHLYLNRGDRKPICRLGYTGDTGAYGCGGEKPAEGSVASQFKDCEILVAHLGDARLREISTAIMPGLKSGTKEAVPLSRLLQDWFCVKSNGQVAFDPDRMTRESAEEFLHLMISLHLIDRHALIPLVRPTSPLNIQEKVSVVEYLRIWLNDWDRLESGRPTPGAGLVVIDNTLDLMHRALLSQLKQDGVSRTQLAGCRQLYKSANGHVNACLRASRLINIKKRIYILLAILSMSCRIRWTYDQHLGVLGIEHLFKEMYLSMREKLNKRSERYQKAVQGVFVVGELPEELSSYRHRIARWLNWDIVNQLEEGPAKAVYAFTGDIGLHIRLEREDKFSPGIRCDYCNLNNETARKRDSYYSPRKIRETVIKALDSKMVYLCKAKDHHPEYFDDTYYLHLFQPEVKRL